jgi:hypothetical protein
VSAKAGHAGEVVLTVSGYIINRERIELSLSAKVEFLAAPREAK